MFNKITNIKISPMRRNELICAFVFISPLVIGIGIFYFFAFFQNIYYSFTDLASFGKPNFIGIDNYKVLLTDKKFYIALINTLKYVAICVPGIVIFATLAAVLLDSKLRGMTFFRTVLFIPAVTLPAAISLLWRWLYNDEFGILNIILDKYDIPKIGWLSDPKLVLYSVAFVIIWSMISTQMILILAGLKNIPKMYYESSQIDGANKWQVFGHITLPLLSPTLFFVITMTVINIFQVFDYIFMMLNSESLSMRYGMSIVYYFYQKAFIEFNRGYASAISMLLFGIIMIFTIIQLRLQKKWVNYDS
ncbi:carbohydrate ABC transporter permease [Vallitalea sp.]|uniref:carbohydrate ABC transporter permease n=1 Tax=Vallitalea sp. TaxID=1882829 RepID=UPI0025F26DEA|nr:sugar ABC transporter permease [Vallitalea sp.]MCT4687841.1 sugar ABC transporter permease [Vallitalea sp.]